MRNKQFDRKTKEQETFYWSHAWNAARMTSEVEEQNEIAQEYQIKLMGFLNNR